MYVSNRALLAVALLSGIVVVGLTLKSPIAHSVNLLHAKTDLTPSMSIETGPTGNVVAVKESVTVLREHPTAIPESLAPLIRGFKPTRPLPRGQVIHLEDVVPLPEKDGTGESTYVRLSGLLDPSEKAVALRTDDLGSFAYSLEPGDRIDILLAGDRDSVIQFRDLRVLAVGARAREGWTSPSRRQDDYASITLAVPASDAEQLAQKFLPLGSPHPKVLLRSSRQ